MGWAAEGWLIREGDEFVVRTAGGDLVRRWSVLADLGSNAAIDFEGGVWVAERGEVLSRFSPAGDRLGSWSMAGAPQAIGVLGPGELGVAFVNGRFESFRFDGTLRWNRSADVTGFWKTEFARAPGSRTALVARDVELRDEVGERLWRRSAICNGERCEFFFSPVATPEGLLVFQSDNFGTAPPLRLDLLDWGNGSVRRAVEFPSSVPLASPFVLGPDGTLIGRFGGSETLAIDTCTSGPADTDWPMAGHDVLRTNNVNVKNVPRDWRVAILRAAHAPGAFGSDWRTDLDLVNPSTDPSVVSLYWWPESSPGLCAANVVYRTVPARGSLRIPDVVSSVFGAVGAGVVELRSFSGDPRARARTWNAGASGSFGTEVPGLPPSAALKPGESGTLAALVRTSAFRTNVGFWNASGDEAALELVLYAPDGTELGRVSASLGVRENRQWNDVFAAAGVAGDVESAWGEVRVTSASGLVHVYASVTDNATGDPVFVPVDRGPEPVATRAVGCPAVGR